jgi:hypothetical protein
MSWPAGRAQFDCTFFHRAVTSMLIANSLMRGARVVFGLILFVTAGAGLMQGQIPTLSGGTRIRLAIQNSDAIIQGTVFSQVADSIRIASGDVVQVVPTASIVAMQVGSGRSHTRGALVGLKRGAIIVGGAGAVLFGSGYATYEGQKQPSDLAGLIAVSAYAGAFYGAIIGAAIGSEQWTNVYPERVAMTLAPVPNGRTGVGVSLRF